MEEKEIHISGISCMSCVSKLEKAFYESGEIAQVTIDKDSGKAMLKGEVLPSETALDKMVSSAGNYSIDATFSAGSESSFYTRYKPLLLIAAFLLGTTLLLEWSSGMFLLETWMANFMAGFFLVFSFFKLLDLNGFASAYESYDLIAKRVKAYGYVYPFIELGLGLAYLLYSDNVVTHIVTIIVMFVSLLGVIQAVIKKSKIQCACLGTVFNLPMSSVTIIEDTLMLVMALLMYLKFL